MQTWAYWFDHKILVWGQILPFFQNLNNNVQIGPWQLLSLEYVSCDLDGSIVCVFPQYNFHYFIFPKYRTLPNSDGETQILGMLIKREF